MRRVLFLSSVVVASLAASSAQLPGVGLGAPVEAFVVNFGKPARTSREGVFQDFLPCPGSGASAADCQFMVQFQDGRALAILHRACSPAKHDEEGAWQEVQFYMPGDALVGKEFTTEKGWPAREYYSEALASAFPPSSFRDCAGRELLPGTFSYSLSPEREAWILGLGTCL